MASTYKAPLYRGTQVHRTQSSKNRGPVQVLKPPTNLYSETAVHLDAQELNSLRNVPSQTPRVKQTAAACFQRLPGITLPNKENNGQICLLTSSSLRIELWASILFNYVTMEKIMKMIQTLKIG